MSSGCINFENQGVSSVSHRNSSYMEPSADRGSRISHISLLQALSIHPSSDHQLHHHPLLNIPRLACSSRNGVVDDDLCDCGTRLPQPHIYTSTLSIIDSALHVINAAELEDRSLRSSGRTRSHNKKCRTRQGIAQ
jgi:hypothetical protein